MTRAESAGNGPLPIRSRRTELSRGCLASPKYVSMTGVVSKGFVVKVYVAL